jgi:heterodisulfide reductase subunit B
LLHKILKLVPAEFEKDDTLCCGNSLANFSASNDVRLSVARDAYKKLTAHNTHYLVTSCPMCKKAFEKVSTIPVRDIAELVSNAVQKQHPRITAANRNKEPVVALTLH